jgi:hypothetical protein
MEDFQAVIFIRGFVTRNIPRRKGDQMRHRLGIENMTLKELCDLEDKYTAHMGSAGGMLRYSEKQTGGMRLGQPRGSKMRAERNRAKRRR